MEIGYFSSHFDVQKTVEKLLEEVKTTLHKGDIQDTLISFAKNTVLSAIKSNKTCMTCLSRFPVHPLPCRHAICDPCAIRFNANPSKRENHVLKILGCPLGCKSWRDPWRIRLKPTTAGVRVLSLDG